MFRTFLYGMLALLLLVTLFPQHEAVARVRKSSNLEWQKTIAFPDDVSVSAYRTVDGGVLYYGSDYWDRKLYLKKVGVNGKEEWDQVVEDVPKIDTIQSGKDGRLAFGGGRYEEYVIAVVNAKGQVEWKKKMAGSKSADPFTEFYTFAMTSDGGMLLIGEAREKDENLLYLVKTGKNGEALWEQTYINARPDSTGTHAIYEMKDKGYVLILDVNDGANVALVIDAKGQKRWEQQYIGEIDSIPTMDGGIMILGNPYKKGGPNLAVSLLKLDKNGKKQWEKSLEDTLYTDSHRLIETSKGEIIVSSVYYSMGMKLVSYSPTGKLNWQMDYGDTRFAGATLYPVEDGGILAEIVEEPSFFSPNLHIAKLNSYGRVEWQHDYEWPFGGDVIQTRDGKYIGVGKRYRQYNKDDGDEVFALNQNGEPLWQVKIKGVVEALWETREKEILLHGRDLDDQRFIAKLKKSGENLPQIKSLSVSENQILLREKGEERHVTATVRYSDGRREDVTEKATWKIEGLGHISLTPGKITAEEEGRTFVSVTYLGKSQTIPVTVMYSKRALWEQIFGGRDTENGVSIFPTKDGGYILTGTNVNNNSKAIIVIKVDKTGKKTWEKTFSERGRAEAGSIRQTSDGGYVLVSNSESGKNYTATIRKLDKSGRQKWFKTFKVDGAHIAGNLEITKDGNLIFVAGESLYKLDENGKTVWMTDLGQAGTHVVETEQGDFLVGNRGLVKVSSTGKVLWKTATRGGSFVFTAMPDGSSLHSMDRFITKVDSKGSEVWTKQVIPDSIDPMTTSIQMTPDQGYVLVAKAYDIDNDEEYILVVRLNQQGRVVWREDFGVGNQVSPNEVQIAQDGDFLLVGTARTKEAGDAWGDTENIYVLKVADREQ